MKKFFITVGVLMIIAVGYLAVRPGSKPEDLNVNQAINQAQEPRLKPWEVNVGLYDPNQEPNKLTKLLESRLKELGFKTAILAELVDPGAVNQEIATLLFRLNTQEALAVVIDKAMAKTSSYRQGQNDAILQDVIISAWSIDDINWGSFAELAGKYNNPDPAEVTVSVINIGAESGTAAKVAGLLKDAGYNQAIAKNAKKRIVRARDHFIGKRIKPCAHSAPNSRSQARSRPSKSGSGWALSFLKTRSLRSCGVFGSE